MYKDKKVVLISGGSRGLGEAIVKRNLSQGNYVATFSRSKSEFIEDMLKTYKDTKQFMWSSVDITDSSAIKNFTQLVVDAYGKIDVLINNVGMALEGIFGVTRAKDIQNCVDFNLSGPLFLSQICCKAMLRQKQGNIINISSVNALRGHSGVVVYSATKAAIDGFTRSLAREVGRMNIRVNSIAPGYFESEMVKDLSETAKNRIKNRTPLGRLANVDEIVNGVMFLISKEASFITGQTLVIDGGITC